MYVVKQIPEDFIVDEISNIEFKPGRYYCYWLKKKDYATLAAIQLVAKANNIPVLNFSWAGNKDRKAVTKQLISVKNQSLYKVEFKDVELVFAGTLDRPVSLGMLKGNDFLIIIRNIEKIPQIKEKFINYFGEQRFSENNARVGRAMIKGDFQKAAELLKLDVKDNNFISAIRSLPKKVLSLYIYAYQSLIWNMAVEFYIKDNPKFDQSAELVIVGFGSENLDRYTKKILEAENISQKDFIIKQLPDISSEGSQRKVWAKAENMKINNLEDDELNTGKKKVKLEFFLPKGCYATEFIKQNFQ